MTENDRIAEYSWAEMLMRAVAEPGMVSKAYGMFHNYSLGNRFLVLLQCLVNDVEPGPMSSYKGWQKLGRQVVKGQKAMVIWHPRQGKRVEVDPNTGEEKMRSWTYFILKNTAFVYSQTDGEEVEFPEIGWDREKALEELGIEEAPFHHTDGNAQGYAFKNSVSINPVAENPAKTLFHEIAHVLLGHTRDDVKMVDSQGLTYADGEVEAESVAMLCVSALGLDGVEYSRGYIQNWVRAGGEHPEAVARKIFS